MAVNFADALAILADELHEPEDDVRLRRALVRSLRHHRSFKFLFSERTATMDLRSGVWQYGVEDGLPGDILKFNAISVQTDSTSNQSVMVDRMVSAHQMRALHTTANATGYPDTWVYYAEQLWLYPTPGGSYLLTLDIQSDFTRDEDGGGLIREDSDEATNVFIRDGEEALVARAAATYAVSIQGNPEKAQAFLAVHSSAMKNLLRERDIMKLDGAQVTAYGL